jgi:O-antigen ligase
MCGIAGFVNREREPATSERVRRMINTIVHRGPDDEGIHAQGNVGGRRFPLVATAIVLNIVGAGVVVATPHYLVRVESIFRGNIEDSGDRGSWGARRQLLVDSVEQAVHHPIFGIGAGNFGAATLTWHVTHNTYTEFAAEGGFPALFLYLAILYMAYRNLRRTRLLPAYQANPEVRLFAGALWASLIAFAIMMAYTSVLYRLDSEHSSQEANSTAQKPAAGGGNLWHPVLR